MKKISEFFDRFNKLTPPHDALKKAVANALSDKAGIVTSPDTITIQNNIAFVKVSSVAKNSIHINRGKILEQIFDELPKARDLLRDIR